MSATARYVVAGLALAVILFVGAWPFLDAGGRRGMLVAFAVALPMQGVFFRLLSRGQDRPGVFLRAWVLGMLGRLAALGGFALVVAVGTELPPLPTLVSFAGFLFGLLLLEPAFLRNPVRVHGRGR